MASETNETKKDVVVAQKEAVQRIRETLQKEKQRLEKERLEKEAAIAASHQVIRRCPKVEGNPEAARFAAEQAQLQRKRQEQVQRDLEEKRRQAYEEQKRKAAEEEAQKLQEHLEYKKNLQKKREENKVQTKLQEENKLALNRVKEFKQKDEKQQLMKINNNFVYQSVNLPQNNNNKSEQKKQIIHHHALPKLKPRVSANPEAAEFCTKAQREQRERQKKREADLLKAEQQKAMKTLQEAQEREDKIQREMILHHEKVRANRWKNNWLTREVQESQLAAQRVKNFKQYNKEQVNDDNQKK